ncbi:hypothetical protein BS78_05G193400 [Paspalum vaginatum]|nr:hypothetical protein BS78_05G193400 [Paspalum vaginatum]
MRACVQVHQVTSSRRCPMKVQIEASNRGKYHCYHQTTKVQADQVLGPWLRRARQNTGASPARWERGRTRRRNLQSTPQFSCPINKGARFQKSSTNVKPMPQSCPGAAEPQPPGRTQRHDADEDLDSGRNDKPYSSTPRPKRREPWSSTSNADDDELRAAAAAQDLERVVFFLPNGG